MKTEILGFIYDINGEEEMKIDISPVIPKREPRYLFKYLPLTDYAVDSLKKSYFYLSTPENFNDPFDCFRGLLGGHFLENDAWHQFLFANIGIVPMTKNGRNVLMWAHYCNNEGITLKFKTEYLKYLMSGVFYMNYQKNLPNLNKYDFITRFLVTMNLKSSKWKYESEWRLLKKKEGIMKSNIEFYDNEALKLGHNTLDRKQYFDNKQLLEITLGFKFFTKENISKSDNTITLKTKKPLKVEILDYIIQEKIYTQMIDFGNITEFELRKVKCNIIKIEEGEYQIILY